MEKIIKKFYFLEFNNAENQFFFKPNTMFFNIEEKLLTCKKYVNWKPLNLLLNDRFDINDLPISSDYFGFPIVNSQLMKFIEESCKDNIQFLKVNVVEKDDASSLVYWLFNVLDVANNVICWENSDWNKNLMKKDPYHLQSKFSPFRYLTYPALRYDLVKNKKIFRLKEKDFISSRIVISKRFKDELVKNFNESVFSFSPINAYNCTEDNIREQYFHY